MRHLRELSQAEWWDVMDTLERWCRSHDVAGKANGDYDLFQALEAERLKISPPLAEQVTEHHLGAQQRRRSS